MDIGRICHLPNVINAHFDKENPMTFIKNRAVHLVAAAVVLATLTACADGKNEVPTNSMAGDGRELELQEHCLWIRSLSFVMNPFQHWMFPFRRR